MVGFLVALVLGLHRDADGVQLGGYRHLLRQRLLLAAQTFNLLRGLLILSLHAGVLLLQVLVQTVQGVYLDDIRAQHGAHRCQFFLQSGNLAGVVGLHLLQFPQQTLRLLLLSRELGHDGVVVDLRLHLAVLHGKLLILVFHFLFVEFSQFLHLAVLLFLLVQVQVQPHQAAYQ